MSMDLKIEMAKDEYVKVINEINNQYELPLSISEIILSAIIEEISRVKNENIAKEKEMLMNVEKEVEK